MLSAVACLIIAAIAFVGLLLIAAYALGVRHTNGLWVLKASEPGGLRKECDGQLYYVARCDDHEATGLLRDWIESEQERRADAEHVRRIQGWG